MHDCPLIQEYIVVVYPLRVLYALSISAAVFVLTNDMHMHGRAAFILLMVVVSISDVFQEASMGNNWLVSAVVNWKCIRFNHALQYKTNKPV